MEWATLILRYAHVFFAVLWTSLALAVVLLLGPSLMALGPPERKLVQLQLLPRQLGLAALASLGTVLTGLLQMQQMYLGEAGFGLMNDRGYWLLVGAGLGLSAFLMALLVMMPTAKRIEATLKGDGDPAQLPVLGGKMAKFGRVVMMHLIETLACMLLASHALLAFSAGNVIGVLLGAGALGYGLIFFSGRLGPKA